MHSRVLSPAKRPIDVNKEARGQKLVNAKSRRSKSKKSKRLGPKSILDNLKL